MRSPVILLFFLIIGSFKTMAQCGSGINTFPYNEGFEASDGGWIAGGAGNDWAWGTPLKPVITGASGGVNCWVVGGLTGSSYTNAEASWLQSPCFDFTTLQYPYIEFKVFWEMEQQFDGASFQYSTDNGNSWINVGARSDPSDCLHANWFNYSPITYLSPLSSIRDGWSGNIQPSSGSCRGGNGSNGWVLARHTMSYLAGKAGVLFRFIFGAGTICNNYDGFAVDDISIKEAPPNAAAFNYSCVNNNMVNFTNNSVLCPTGYNWNFGDAGSGSNNISTAPNPSHVFSGPGMYTVTLTVSGPGNAPSTTTRSLNILSVTSTQLTPADCQTNLGGSLMATATGSPGPFNYSWNTSPVQNTATAVNLGAGSYTVTASSPGACPASATTELLTDLSCIGVYFPTAFTPNNDIRNNLFGPLGSLSSIRNYKFSVYNRWGERVFYSTSPFEKWNGKVKGLPTDGNVFAWYAEFDLPGKPRELQKGTVVLIR